MQCCECVGLPLHVAPLSKQGTPLPALEGQGDPPVLPPQPGLGKTFLASFWGRIPRWGALPGPHRQRGQRSGPTRGKSGHPPLPSPAVPHQPRNLPQSISIPLPKKPKIPMPPPPALLKTPKKWGKKKTQNRIPLQLTRRHSRMSQFHLPGEQIKKRIHRTGGGGGVGRAGSSPPGQVLPDSGNVLAPTVLW